MAHLAAPASGGHSLLTSFLAGFHSAPNVSLRLTLWDGSQHDLGLDPQVTVRLSGVGALRYFVPPSLDNLADGYVSGRFDVEGRAQDIVEVASQLAHQSVPRRGRFGRLLSLGQHDRVSDHRAIEHHYDVSNDFYRLWLGEAMVYSCAYFPNGTETLSEAQNAKLDYILAKLMLKPGERLLDIGCGWGALVLRAAQKWGAQAVGVTLSRSQFELASQRVAEAGLDGQVEIRFQDYRDIDERDGQFDKISSVGMFEHVGLNHLTDYFAKIHALLKDGGLVLNHGITSTDAGSGASPLGAASFIHKYVFPNGELPHISRALRDMQTGGLEVLDVECLRRHYARTLTLWSANFEKNSDAIRHMVDETTYRVWRIYLAGCAHAFAQNWVSVHQILACKEGTHDSLNPTPWSRSYIYAAPLDSGNPD